MISDKFLHPYHIIPAAEFVTALMEPSDKAVPHMFMEPDAVQGQIFVFLFRIGNTGVKVQDVLGFQAFLQRAIEHPADPSSFLVLADVYAIGMNQRNAFPRRIRRPLPSAGAAGGRPCRQFIFSFF